ncbi:MAG: hypothetical protein WCY49_04975 [Anaerovoracaceae bacterium]|nr:hypothetical protein [Clostridiales bacterium]
MKKLIILLLLISLFLLTFTACNHDEEQPQGANDPLANAVVVMEFIKENNWEAVSLFVNEDTGLRFTPYDYVDIDYDIVFAKEDLSTLSGNGLTYQWGIYDGSGHPILLTFDEYYDLFIYDLDFANTPDIGDNEVMRIGNTPSNIEEVYPDSVFFDFYFDGVNPEYEGIDWRSLKLIFTEYNGTYYLEGIIHGQWTG